MTRRVLIILLLVLLTLTSPTLAGRRLAGQSCKRGGCRPGKGLCSCSHMKRGRGSCSSGCMTQTDAAKSVAKEVATEKASGFKNAIKAQKSRLKKRGGGFKRAYKGDICEPGQCVAQSGQEAGCKCDPDHFMSCVGDGCLDLQRRVGRVTDKPATPKKTLFTKKVLTTKGTVQSLKDKFDKMAESKTTLFRRKKKKIKRKWKRPRPSFRNLKRKLNANAGYFGDELYDQDSGIFGDYYDYYNNMDYITQIIMLVGGVMIFSVCCVVCIGFNIICAYVGWVLGKKVIKNGSEEYKRVQRRSITDIEQNQDDDLTV